MGLPKTKRAKIILVVIVVAAIAVIAGVAMYAASKSDDASTDNVVAQASDLPATEPQQTDEQPTEETVKQEEPATPAAPAVKPPDTPASQWPVQLNSSQAASLTVVVNKKHKLPSSYAPALGPSGRLRAEAEAAFNTLLLAAKAAGATSMQYVSGYRSYAKQEQLYDNYVAQDGQAAADTYSARPGHSEHQTGLSVDIGEGGGCDLETCFENTTSAKWAAANAHTYGFVIRYPKGKDSITGYMYEPWHLRYLGVSEANAVYNSGKTLEEYYGVPGGGYQ